MPLDVARTMAVNTLVIAQSFYLVNSRFLEESSLRPRQAFTNPVAWMAVAALTLLQVAFVYLPPMHDWFGTAPLALRHWLVPLGIGVSLFLLIEAEKAILRGLRP
jgi:magnesium-transporting ATPase (P-type)